MANYPGLNLLRILKQILETQITFTFISKYSSQRQPEMDKNDDYFANNYWDAYKVSLVTYLPSSINNAQPYLYSTLLVALLITNVKPCQMQKELFPLLHLCFP